ncbi:putative pentatricopeptide repeat-containing protein At3g15200 isoform X1 [Salvia splendens]|nr:putative pentatricopeptide repeat-containing protein At3g15200 isoform X1 [Salvia splendens]XP_042032056.1 putative pentatricopeptide repeat-containing protein At3g15200 isoform X1 [Salvia splendens]XP_042032057.1 putative pentatricopeptide repeat-containing protein At3g15200 isoform X1 [Salvia splendens]
MRNLQWDFIMNSRFRLRIATVLRYNYFSIRTISSSIDDEALRIQFLLKNHFHEAAESVDRRLEQLKPPLSHELALNVLKRHRSDWKSAYTFFRWLSDSSGYSPETSIYNEIADILGQNRRFDELRQLLDEMPRRKKSMDERTYAVVVSRLAAAHRVDEAIQFFDGMEESGFRRDLPAFQTLLLALCRYKHVERAEFLFRVRKSEFGTDIKTWNIVLNGWCVLRSLPDAKRFWRDILASDCKPDRYTYGIFINSLCKSGKAGRSLELLRAMWEQGCSPDAAICNTVIDGLCFKKRIPEALEVFREMREKGCSPNNATYNSLIKHLCKIQRMEVVEELVKEMEETGGSCAPNALTYGFLLRAARNVEQVDGILERVKDSGCEVGGDFYNMVLRLFVGWGDEERVRCVWGEMERRGVGPDRRSYTIVVHGLCEMGRGGAALEYFAEMECKGMFPEPRTKMLVEEMRYKLSEGERGSERRLRKGNGLVKQVKKAR